MQITKSRSTPLPFVQISNMKSELHICYICGGKGTLSSLHILIGWQFFISGNPQSLMVVDSVDRLVESLSTPRPSILPPTLHSTPVVLSNVWLWFFAQFPSTARSKPLREHLCQVPVCKHNIVLLIVLGITSCPWHGFYLGSSTDWPFSQTLLHLCPYTSCRQDRF